MRAFNKHVLAMVFGFLPMMAMAHPGHDQTHVGFLGRSDSSIYGT